MPAAHSSQWSSDLPQIHLGWNKCNWKGKGGSCEWGSSTHCSRSQNKPHNAGTITESLLDSEEQPEQEWHPWGHTSDMWHLLLPIWSPLGSPHSWDSFGSFLCLFRPTSQDLRNLSGTNQPEHIRVLGSLHPSPVPHTAPARRNKSSLVSGRQPDWSSRDSTSIKLQKPGQCCKHSCVGMLPLLKEFSKGNHTLQLASQDGITAACPGNAAPTERFLERRMCFVTACSSVQL